MKNIRFAHVRQTPGADHEGVLGPIWTTCAADTSTTGIVMDLHNDCDTAVQEHPARGATSGRVPARRGDAIAYLVVACCIARAMGVQVDEARRQHVPGAVDDPLRSVRAALTGHEVAADRHDPAAVHGDVANGVEAGPGVDDPGPADQQIPVSAGSRQCV